MEIRYKINCPKCGEEMGAGGDEDGFFFSCDCDVLITEDSK